MCFLKWFNILVGRKTQMSWICLYIIWHFLKLLRFITFSHLHSHHVYWFLGWYSLRVLNASDPSAVIRSQSLDIVAIWGAESFQAAGLKLLQQAPLEANPHKIDPSATQYSILCFEWKSIWSSCYGKRFIYFFLLNCLRSYCGCSPHVWMLIKWQPVPAGKVNSKRNVRKHTHSIKFPTLKNLLWNNFLSTSIILISSIVSFLPDKSHITTWFSSRFLSHLQPRSFRISYSRLPDKQATLTTPEQYISLFFQQSTYICIEYYCIQSTINTAIPLYYQQSTQQFLCSLNNQHTLVQKYPSVLSTI